VRSSRRNFTGLRLEHIFALIFWFFCIKVKERRNTREAARNALNNTIMLIWRVKRKRRGGKKMDYEIELKGSIQSGAG
jgi:hypothetical protein